MRAGHLEPVDVDIGRVVRWVTAESVDAYVNRATRAGEYALRLCSRCQGIRYVQAGSDTCGLCADRVAEQALEQAEARRTRKRAWWADNGPAWRSWQSLAGATVHPTQAKEPRMSDPHDEHHHAESDTNQDGVVSMEEAVAGGEEHMAAQAADVEAAAEPRRHVSLPSRRPKLDTTDAGLLSRGMAPYSDLTSPGGPWHGLPPEAATDPNSPDWAENQRWAVVQGSFFAATVDGTATIGDHAENVRAYGIPSDPDGQAFMRSISTLPEDQIVAKCVEVGNGIAYDGTNVNYTV